jgi:hypothetical protein
MFFTLKHFETAPKIAKDRHGTCGGVPQLKFAGIPRRVETPAFENQFWFYY